MSIVTDRITVAELQLHAAAIHIKRTSNLHYLASACVYTHYDTEIDRFLIGVTEVFAMRKPWHRGNLFVPVL